MTTRQIRTKAAEKIIENKIQKIAGYKWAWRGNTKHQTMSEGTMRLSDGKNVRKKKKWDWERRGREGGQDRRDGAGLSGAKGTNGAADRGRRGSVIAKQKEKKLRKTEASVQSAPTLSTPFPCSCLKAIFVYWSEAPVFLSLFFFSRVCVCACVIIG